MAATSPYGGPAEARSATCTAPGLAASAASCSSGARRGMSAGSTLASAKAASSARAAAEPGPLRCRPSLAMASAAYGSHSARHGSSRGCGCPPSASERQSGSASGLAPGSSHGLRRPW